MAQQSAASGDESMAPLRSQERILDAEAIEAVAAQMTRPTARMHLESLAKKLRKEGEALQRVEKSSSIQAQSMDVDEKKEGDTDVPQQPLQTPVAAAASSRAIPSLPSTAKFIPIDRFSFDAGGYNAPFVTVYVTLPGVGSIDRDLIQCQFQTSTFDLVVKDLNGKSYRLFQDNLEKDIDASKSKIIVKSDKVLVKLAKVKQSDYGGYDYWSKLSDKKAREKSNKIKDNPQSSIMDLMKQMYDEGDDNMKKIIGETMMKQQRGEINKDDPMQGMDKMDL